MRSVYIHIPFCSSICSYCDFSKVIYSSSWAEKYLCLLEEEINEYYEDDEVKSIYIGGGTPSCLNIEEIKRLFNITKKFKLSEHYEFTFEMNPNDINEQLVKLLKENGVNRVSIGVETFDKNTLKFLNRKHTKDDIKKGIKLLKFYGFDNINIDLIYATMNQDLPMLKKDIRRFLKLDIDHISTYSLIIENNTVLKYKNIKNINEELDYKMYTYICNKLKKHGYNHYEVSNFAKEGYESIHNKTYWKNKEYYGFGLGAHAYINGVRSENTRSLNKYLSGSFKLSEYFLSKKEDMENELMLGLRLLEGINIVNFYEKFGVNIQDEFNITEMLKIGLLKLEKNNIKIPEDKMYIMNEIINNLIK